jgi:type 1 glutamine amidotransferase
MKASKNCPFLYAPLCTAFGLAMLISGCSGQTQETGAADLEEIAETGDQIRVLIIDGVNNHDWESTTAATKATLEQTGRFLVDVSTSPRKEAPRGEWEAWRPAFSDYQVVVSNFNDDCAQEGGCEPLWSAETMADFERFVSAGGGFVAIHAADNHAAGWAAYNEMIGLGGWGGRRAGMSGSLLRLIDGEWVATSPDEGISGEHGPQREFLVIHDQPTHPILDGLPGEWMHATDELYSSLRGPARNIEVLAHSFSLYTNENEPVLMIITYGEGKVFHITLGHYDDQSEPPGAAVSCVGYQTVLARGTEYVATGEVTIGMPGSFPSAEEAVVIPPRELEW